VDQVDLSGFLIPSDEGLDRIAEHNRIIIGDGDLFGSLLSLDPTMTGMHPDLKSRNNPNPVNQSTSIEFSLGIASHVKLIVFNFSGAQVTQLVGGNYGVGLHTALFNPGSLSAGTYHYVNESNGVREVKRMAYLNRVKNDPKFKLSHRFSGGIF